MLRDMVGAFKTAGPTLLKNAANLGEAIIKRTGWFGFGKKGAWDFAWIPLLESFKATTEKLPEDLKPAFINVKAATDALFDEIAQDEANRPKPKPKPGPPPGPKKPGPADEVMKETHEYKLASAVEIGSREASSIIAKSLSGGTDPARQHVVIAKQQDKKLGQIVDNTKPKPKPDGVLVNVR
jgi:hypothetical protein